MAGTFGEPGKNAFGIPGVGGILSPVVNDATGVTQVYRQGAFKRYQSLGTYNPSTNKFTPDANAGLTQIEKAALSNPANLKTLKDKSSEAVSKGVQAAGGTPEKGQATANKLLSPNKANNPDEVISSTPAPGTDSDEVNQKNLTLTYPEDIGSTKQDVIKFTLLEYKPSGIGATKSGLGQGLSLGGDRGALLGNNEARFKNRERKGTVILPIPSGISDTNSCDWGANTLTAAQAVATSAAFTTITQGFEKGTKIAIDAITAAQGDASFKTGVASLFAGAAANGDAAAILKRADGSVINPNMELLFNAPTLRPFSFTFKMSARNKDEGKTIIDIIRFFKRGMSPKKTEPNIFLKTPNTFSIQYLLRGSGGKDHPFIGRIKECALQSFTVNYTPEGQYATYSDGVMVSYEIQMQFTELEPVFNSDYDAVKDGIGY